MTGKKESTNVKVNVEEDVQEALDREVEEPDGGEADAPIDDTEVSLEEKYEAAIEESKQTYDRFLRVSAEFDNFKKAQEPRNG